MKSKVVKDDVVEEDKRDKSVCAARKDGGRTFPSEGNVM